MHSLHLLPWSSNWGRRKKWGWFYLLSVDFGFFFFPCCFMFCSSNWGSTILEEGKLFWNHAPARTCCRWSQEVMVWDSSCWWTVNEIHLHSCVIQFFLIIQSIAQFCNVIIMSKEIKILYSYFSFQSWDLHPYMC